MQLISAWSASSVDLSGLVREVKAVKIYFVWNRRTEWHELWTDRPAYNCMHTTWLSARDYCEANRIQGRAFLVKELPAIAFLDREHALLVTESDTIDILGKFDVGKFVNLTSSHPVSTMTLQQVYELFRSKSDLWPKYHFVKDPVVLAFGTANQLTSCTPNSTFIRKASMSKGGNSPLLWIENPFPVDFWAITDLVAKLNAEAVA